MGKRRRLPVITKKIVSGIVLAGFILCATISMAGYWSFSRQFRVQYDSTMRSICSAARSALDPDAVARYIETKTVDEQYHAIKHILQDFVDKFELNLLYVSAVEAPEYSHITYIFNPVMKGGKWSEFPFGYSEVYVEPNYNSSAKRVFENGETIVRHTLKTRSGSHITAMLPVYDSAGKIIAVIGAQKNIQNFVSARLSFVTFVIFVGVIFGLLFVIAFSAYFSVSFIKPLTTITKETDHFASYGGKPSDRLLEIKKRDEIGTLAHSVHQMEYDVCRNMDELEKITAEKERISTELSVATKIQIDALPKGYPAFPERKDFALTASMDPAKEVGGDLYDYLLIDDDRLMFIVGDVSGKGVPAALFMMTAKTLLTTYGAQGLSPAKIFELTNTQLCKGNDTGMFVTCWLGILTFSTGELRFVNAGHPSPVLFKKATSEFSYLKTKPNFVLGCMEDSPYTEHSINLDKGDRLFVYTDGVVEATDSENQLYGEERLLNVMQKTEEMSVKETLEAVRESIDDFVGEAEQFDDITTLAFDWTATE